MIANAFCSIKVLIVITIGIVSLYALRKKEFRVFINDYFLPSHRLSYALIFFSFCLARYTLTKTYHPFFQLRKRATSPKIFLFPILMPRNLLQATSMEACPINPIGEGRSELYPRMEKGAVFCISLHLYICIIILSHDLVLLCQLGGQS